MAQKAESYKPDYIGDVTVHLWFNGNCADALEWYEKVFDAGLLFEPMQYPEGGKIMHAMIQIGDTQIMTADAWSGSTQERGPGEYSTAGLWTYVKDCDRVFNKAVDMGASIQMPLSDSFWGDRFGKVKDPFGHFWSIATAKWVYTQEEMDHKQLEMMNQKAG